MKAIVVCLSVVFGVIWALYMDGAFDPKEMSGDISSGEIIVKSDTVYTEDGLRCEVAYRTGGRGNILEYIGYTCDFGERILNEH